MKYLLLFIFVISILLSCEDEKKYNFDKSEIDQIFIKVCDSFITNSVKKHIWIEYKGNVKDTSIYSINQVNNILVDGKLFPYKIFKIKNKWCFIAKTNEKINHNNLLIFLKENNLYYENVDFWPSYKEKYWYVKIYKNEFGKFTFSRVINSNYLYGRDIKYEFNN